MLHRRVHKREDDVEVVDHQIEHNPDVHAPCREGREPMRLDETRRLRGLLQIVVHWVKAFDMTNLQHTVVPLGQAHQLGRLVEVVGHRLFDQQVFALLQQRLGQAMMRGRRCDYAQGIRRRCLLN